MSRGQRKFMILMVIIAILLFVGMSGILIDAANSVKYEYKEELLNKENVLSRQIDSLQSERDSLQIESDKWNIEKDSLLGTLRVQDGVWLEKSKGYAAKKDSVVYSSSVSELADFLSRY